MFNFTVLKTISESPFGSIVLLRDDSYDGDGKMFIGKHATKDHNLNNFGAITNLWREKLFLERLKGGPFIIKYYETLQNQKDFLIVMEHLKVSNLTQMLSRKRRHKCMPESDLIYFAAEIITGLEYIHSKGIIHRDIKPENIGIDEEGHIAIFDFGLSAEIPSTRSSKLNQICGTFLYRAPEMESKQGYDQSADWWSLGMTLNYMITRRLTYITPDYLTFPAHVSENAADLIRKLLMSNPEERLGGGGRGAEEIKTHPLFHDIDWDKILKKEVESPVKKRYYDRRSVSTKL